MRYFCLFILFFFSPVVKGWEGTSFAQNKNIDSLLILIKKDKLDTNKVNDLNQLSIEYKYVGLFDTTTHFLNTALQLAEKLKYKKGIARTFHNIGNVYLYKSNYPQALNYYFKALQIYEELKDKGKIANVLNNIGIVYSTQGDYSKALDYYFKALKMIKELGDRKLSARYFTNIGLVYGFQRDFDKALNYHQQALEIYEGLKDQRDMAIEFANMGVLYDVQRNYIKAIDYLFKSLKIAEELGDKKVIARNTGSIGALYVKIGEFTEAEKYLKKATVIDNDLGAVNDLMDVENYLSQLYDTTKQYNLALIHYKKSVALKDTIFSQENKKQLVRKEMNYEFEKKTAEINAENEKQQAIAAEKNRNQKIIIWSVISGLLLVLVFAGFVFRSLRVTRKQKNIIELQKNEVSKQKDVADSQRIIAESLREVSEKQKELVEEKQKEIIQSITYAKRIQTALLTSNEYIKEHLPAEHFILFKPKDIVSGDFYWAISTPPLPGWDMGTNKVKLPSDSKRKNTFYMMTADCTGHGVPGAFMSMLNISYLHENIVERGVRLPHDILNSQRKEIIQALNPVGSTEESKDGMDCTLCVYDFDKMLLHFAAANNPLYLIRNRELTEYKADKMPVGKYHETMAPFSLQTITLQKGDIVYTSTDGFADQFGVNGKKLMKKKFKEELLKIHQLPMNEQKEYLNNFFENWKGTNEQVDDVCVIGVRI